MAKEQPKRRKHRVEAEDFKVHETWYSFPANISPVCHTGLRPMYICRKSPRNIDEGENNNSFNSGFNSKHGI